MLGLDVIVVRRICSVSSFYSNEKKKKKTFVSVSMFYSGKSVLPDAVQWNDCMPRQTIGGGDKTKEEKQSFFLTNTLLSVFCSGTERPDGLSSPASLLLAGINLPLPRANSREPSAAFVLQHFDANNVYLHVYYHCTTRCTAYLIHLFIPLPYSASLLHDEQRAEASLPRRVPNISSTPLRHSHRFRTVVFAIIEQSR